MLDIARMAIEVGDWQTEFSAKHCARKFGNEFLSSVSCRTKSILEIAVEAVAWPVQCDSSCASVA